ncbi:hypothetical protein M378DRAFT_18193 [Amanita muscaria Koide BX008]|uniref:DDE Tnp4 domain-containing protein n=1 Tax=Amanita muscaria (strain Koide BX008) TaxID=946122 RepID=A0A0C2WGD8_AMAMK|nr:hypothetical protein M378DRAFT_18193 [Amanita muscaria Koide BX008]
MLVGSSFYDKYVQPMPDKPPPEIQSNPKLYPYFKYCRGALDGSYFHAWVREEAMARHRTRKGLISQNVLAACDFSMKFTYILSGWEGSAADSTIFEYAREHDLAIPAGRYLLADAGFPICDELITPYHGVRYHLKEWARGSQRPQTYQELFNLRHAQARNVIERVFGIIKKRFNLLRAAPEYSEVMQAKFVSSIGALHNFIRIHDPSDNAMTESVDGEITTASGTHLVEEGPGQPREISQEELGFQITNEEKERAEARRDRIAKKMWDDYQVILRERQE